MAVLCWHDEDAGPLYVLDVGSRQGLTEETQRALEGELLTILLEAATQPGAERAPGLRREHRPVGLDLATPGLRGRNMIAEILGALDGELDGALTRRRLRVGDPPVVARKVEVTAPRRQDLADPWAGKAEERQQFAAPVALLGSVAGE